MSVIGFLLCLVSVPRIDLIVIGIFEGLLDLVLFVKLVKFLVFDLDEGLFVFEG